MKIVYKKLFVASKDAPTYFLAAFCIGVIIVCIILCCCIAICKKTCCKKKLGDEGKVDVQLIKQDASSFEHDQMARGRSADTEDREHGDVDFHPQSSLEESADKQMIKKYAKEDLEEEYNKGHKNPFTMSGKDNIQSR